MNNYFLLRISALMLILSVCNLQGFAQDSVKKATTVKKTVVTTAKPAVSKTGIPINPKTGKPYSKYGYGTYAIKKYDATKTAHTADSLKKAVHGFSLSVLKYGRSWNISRSMVNGFRKIFRGLLILI